MNKGSSKLKVALISSEVAPFAKTGGLADMVTSLAGALSQLNVEPVFILPKYRNMTSPANLCSESTVHFRQGTNLLESRVLEGTSQEGIPVLLVDIPDFFDRPGVYGEQGKDYGDNCARYAAFNQTILEYIRTRRPDFDILHVHDWQTSLIPFYLKTVYRNDPSFKKIRSVLTIHNLGYQGIFPKENFDQTGLGPHYFMPRYLEFYDQVNLLKGGILSADGINTVSPTYAKEILTKDFGMGLDGILRERQSELVGILNGIDTTIWNPSADTYLPNRFSTLDMEGKKGCKLALQQEIRLPLKLKTPLIAIVSRLVDQKGIDLIIKAIPSLIYLNIQIVFHGQGDQDLESGLIGLARQYPEKIAAKVGYYDEGLAHRIEAGSDFLLMPSRYEPCGLTQMYSQHYGTIPLVHAVGGLVDSVMDASLSPHAGTGLHFKDASSENVESTIMQALSFYGFSKLMPELRHEAMKQDFSWKSSAKDYLNLYESTLAKPKSEVPRGLN